MATKLFQRSGLLVFTLVFTFAFAAFAADDVAQPRSEDFMVEMRDGVKLATTAYFPAGEGPFPVVLTRTPYNKAPYGARASRYTNDGFAFIAQDCRGRFESEGEYVPFENDMEDGYDTVEWIAAQPFSTGKIGMSGASAMGITSNLAAAADPPHLTAAYVIVAPRSLFYESRFINGLFKESHAGGWMRGQGVADQIPAMKKRVVMDDQWKATDFIHHRHNVDIPMYNVGGWYDIFIHGNITNYLYLQNEGREGARGNQKLMAGPFGHGQLSGDLEYPDGGGLGRNADELRWFEYWLKGVDNGIMDEPPVRYYMMASARKGAPSPKNRWVTSEFWPPARGNTPPLKLYLQPGFGLSQSPPSEAGASTSYAFDPENPAPTVGGLNLRVEKGPMDQRAIGDREDYLRFETEALEEDVIIAGSMQFQFWGATDGPDTDFTVKIVDVYPDGYEAIVTDMPIRARYRHGRLAENVKMMTPGEPEKFIIDFWDTALTIEKGHKIAVHISSSNFPRFEVNANTGEAAGESEMPPRIAQNTIYHGADMPAFLKIRVLPEQP